MGLTIDTMSGAIRVVAKTVNKIRVARSPAKALRSAAAVRSSGMVQESRKRIARTELP